MRKNSKINRAFKRGHFRVYKTEDGKTLIQRKVKSPSQKKLSKGQANKWLTIHIQ